LEEIACQFQYTHDRRAKKLALSRFSQVRNTLMAVITLLCSYILTVLLKKIKLTRTIGTVY